MFCTKCGAKNEDNLKFCYQCGNPFDGEQPSDPSQASGFHLQAGQKIKLAIKSKKSMYISLASIAALIIIIVIFVASGRSGVLDSITNAAEGTIDSGSFEFTLETEDEYGYGTESDEVNGVFVYDFKEEEIAYDIDTGDGDRLILYEERVFNITDDEVWSSTDISSELNDIFDYYKDNKDSLDDIADLDLEDIIDEAGLSNYIEADKLQKCMNEFVKNMNDKKYFEDVCNKFSIKKTSKGTTYSFDVDVPDFVESVIDTFSPAIDYDVDDIEDMIMEGLSSIDEFLLEITVKNNRLININMDITVKAWDGDKERHALNLEIENYGKAELDEDEIEDIIDSRY